MCPCALSCWWPMAPLKSLLHNGPGPRWTRDPRTWTCWGMSQVGRFLARQATKDRRRHRYSGKLFFLFGFYCGVASIYEHLQQIVDGFIIFIGNIWYGDKVQLFWFWLARIHLTGWTRPTTWWTIMWTVPVPLSLGLRWDLWTYQIPIEHQSSWLSCWWTLRALW